MRFDSAPTRPRSSPPNYFSRREQYRILALVFALGLVIWAMQKAARPQTWAWLFGGAQLVAVDDSEEDTDIDTRRPPAPLPVGVIQIKIVVA